MASQSESSRGRPNLALSRVDSSQADVSVVSVWPVPNLDGTRQRDWLMGLRFVDKQTLLQPPAELNHMAALIRLQLPSAASSNSSANNPPERGMRNNCCQT